MTLPATLAEATVAPAQTVFSSCSAYFSGVLQAELSLVGGSVTADARRSRLRDATIELGPDDELTLDEVYALLSTPGVELQISRGFVLTDGNTLEAPLGRFIVDQASRTRKGDGGSVSATLADLSERIVRARWTEPYAIASGTGLAEALTELLADRWPDVQSAIVESSCPDTLASAVVLESGSDSDPWADARNLATALGYELYFDPWGVARLWFVPDLGSLSPVFTFERGSAAVMLEKTKTAPLERCYNGVIATGEGSERSVPVRGEAWDDDPSSPTYYLGPLGKVPRFYSSPLIATADAAETAAASLLAKTLGRVEEISWSQIVHPGLAPLDAVAVEISESEVRVFMLDALTIPLRASESMSAVAREISSSFDLGEVLD